MLRYTIAQVMEMKPERPYGGDYCIYLYRDDKTGQVLYVGQSTSPIRRLRQHWTSDTHPKVGAVIRDSQPASLNWLVEFYSVAECETFVLTHNPGDYECYQRCQETYSKVHASATIAERAMIMHHKPTYNRTHKSSKPSTSVAWSLHTL